MKYLKNYKTYLESLLIDVSLVTIDINESLGMFYENVLKSIGAEEVNIYDTFHLPEEEFSDKLNLDLLTTNPEFINSLSSIGMKISSLQNTDDLETFVNKPCRFLFIYRIEANELENPNFMIFQSWNETISKWDNMKTYKVQGDIKNFYDKLSSKVIEIVDGEDVYIYQSANKNEWNLQNLDKENDKFKKYFRKDEFENFINDNKFTINIK
jgi:hypothetical protein